MNTLRGWTSRIWNGECSGHNAPQVSGLSNFVCVEVLRPSQPNGVMSSTVNLPNHMFTGQAWSSKRLTSIVHILSPETDNCPSWISGRERMTVENISWSISRKNVADLSGVKTTTSWTPVGRRIQLSHRGRHSGLSKRPSYDPTK